jgi:hypothetical protein
MPAARRTLALIALALAAGPAPAQVAAWGEYGGDPQHSAAAPAAAAALNAVRWQTPVDLAPQLSGNDLLIHYGSPLITAGNTVVVPVKTGAAGGFQVEARAGADGHLLWTQATDYTLPPLPAGIWTPSYSPAVAPGDRLYYPGAGGTVLTRTNLDAAGTATPSRLAFFGLGNYTANAAAYNANVFINTPITADAVGNVYFGYQVANPSAVSGLQSGIARIDAAGNATFTAAATAANDAAIAKVVQNSAPALSPDGSTLYVAVTTANGSSDSGNGYLLALNSATLAPVGRADLRDVKTPANRAILSENGTASPTVGPDGDVYLGVLENPFASSKGWLLHFNATLTQSKPAGAFGWDDTASVVPKAAVPSYKGASPYLLVTKYNNYAGLGGDGKNKLAVLDPNDTQTDPRTGATVMKEVLTITGVTPDPEFPGVPGAVREWCINTAVVDALTGSVLANSEDGKLYRWDLATNTFTQSIALTSGIGEAYTPTLVGPDGTVYAINDATLFAVGATPVPEPSVLVLTAAAFGGLVALRRRSGR